VGTVDVFLFVIYSQLNCVRFLPRLASRHGHLEVLRVLVVNNGANVNARKLDHQTLLDLSARNEHLEALNLLLERGADVHAVNGEGQTPCQAAIREVADFLREYGAEAESVRFDEISLLFKCDV
jgi:ankyrin repeat protein